MAALYSEPPQAPIIYSVGQDSWEFPGGFYDTNKPTIIVGSGSRTISHLFMDCDTSDVDDMGIRVSGNALFHSTGNSSAWTESGLFNKPIGDFLTGTFDRSLGSRFAVNNAGSIQGIVNSQFIPEPEEYALVFGLFAQVFLIVRCRMMQMKRP